ADRAKSEFVGIVAHDLKVPMTSILGYADLTLMEDNIPPLQVNYLNRIRDTVKRMELLVSDLSDISRIESGHFLMDESRVLVADVVQGLRDALAPQLAAQQHRWVENIAPDLPAMKADYFRLLQVLTNLTSNAFKYTPDGGTITLRGSRLEERIEFSISDTGIGLSPEAVEKLGTKFWRAEDDFTRSKPGTGLGFAITRSLVEQMGSGIYVESQVGQGSQFTFSVAIDKE
ncbi:partial Alkaline phosphatase synthesis sensor protein PhoR, partial [uncultured bacterium]